MNAMPPLGGMPPAGLGGMPPGARGPAPGQVPIQLQYMQQAMRMVPAVTNANPNYKSQVGEVIYEFVEKIAGEEFAPKITGMLIDLPLEDIKAYLQNFNVLEEKVKQAEGLLRDQ